MPYTYSGGGYVENVECMSKRTGSSTYNEVQVDRNNAVRTRWLTFLRHHKYLDQATRAVFLEGCLASFFVVYSDRGPESLRNVATSPEANGTQVDYSAAELTDVGMCFQIVFEVDKYGHVHPSYWVSSMVSDSSATSGYQAEYRAFALAWALWMVVWEVVGLLALGCHSYWAFNPFWGVVAWINIGLLFSTTAYYDPQNFITTADASEENSLADVMLALHRMDMVRTLTAANVAISWVRVIKYMSIVPPFYPPILALILAARDIVVFVIFLGLFVTGVAFGFYVVFGDAIYEFSTLQLSVLTLLRGLVGDFDFDIFADTPYHINGVVSLAIFGVITIYIILTMFITIVDNGFDTARQRVSSDDVQASSILYNDLKMWAGTLRRRATLQRLPSRQPASPGV